LKVGDLVLLKEDWQVKGVYYGLGVVISIVDYPEEGFTSHKVRWLNDFSFHGTEELELISEA
jgi:hypothetical protein